MAGRGVRGREVVVGLGRLKDGQVGRYHGLDEVSRCYLAGFSVRIPSVLGQAACAVVVITPRALRDAGIVQDRHMVMNEVSNTCRRSVEYRGHFFSGDRYSPLLSSIGHYVARGQTDRPHPYSCKYSDPSTPSNRRPPTIRDLQRLDPSLLRG